MNGKQIYDALEYVGADLIDTAEKQRFPTPLWQPVLSAAAVIAVLFGIGTVSLHWQKDNAAEEVTQYSLSLSGQVPETAVIAEEEALPEAEGTDATMYTVQNDRILVKDVPNGIMLISIEGDNYGGILAVVTEPERVSLRSAAEPGEEGQQVGEIGEAYHAVLAVNASLALDSPDGAGDALAGYAMCDGVEYNADAHLGEGYARAEFDAAGRITLKDTAEPVSPGTQNAVEAGPVLIKDGEIMVGSTSMVAPRTCLGQDPNGTIYLLVMEGRIPDGSQGVTWLECAEILKRYGCVTAINLDGGTSSILWYNGEYLTRCSNPMLPEGRILPTALIVKKPDS